MTDQTYHLEDRYTAERSHAFLSGIQALARLPVEQLLVDRRARSNTAAFVCGYPGSPLGGFDGAIAEAAALRPDLTIHHQPGVNEEYAATAVMGSQLTGGRPDAIFDGVLGIWYGKAPGVDRAVDALRHATFAGTWHRGGAVAFVGDDPAAKSSTIPSSSAGVLSDLHMPMLYPGGPAEALDLARHAVALSRASGLWVAIKIVADVADGTASVELDIDRVQPRIPTIEGHEYDRSPNGTLLTPFTLDVEREIYEIRYPIAVEYAGLNRLNRVTAGSADAWLGIMASGVSYGEVREALARLGLRTDDEVASVGLRVFRMQMPLPFDPASVRAFARGLSEIIVVEEKLPNIETLVKDALYAVPDRPLVVGKFDDQDRPLFPGFGSLTADAIAPLLRRRLEPRLAERLAPAPEARPVRIPLAVERTPFYCSGCPHNRSTQVPDGSLVGAGIGCHTMVLFMDPARVGDVAGLTCMGNEGTQWIGMAPFVDRPHLIQNLGDGTYFHSGQLAVTAAVAAGVNITYKLLYNRAVAMTGGQQPQGQLEVPAISRILLEQGVKRVLITADDPGKYRQVALPASVDVWPRERLVEAQEKLAEIPGVTVLIHDQMCAAEARRLRKRGLIESPTQRVVINQRICEGCGDCGEVSNCLSVQPVETPWGRKTRIDQTTCNLDYSCLEGDCPSFMVVETEPSWWGRLSARMFDPASRRSSKVTPSPSSPGVAAPPSGATETTELPIPERIVPDSEFALRITGIGGTGVVTVAQVLGTAALLDGLEVRGLDQIGLSQKAGPVVSDLRFVRGAEAGTNRLGLGQAHLLLALDQLVAASSKGLDVSAPATVVVGSTSTTPTGAMITHPAMETPSVDDLCRRIADATDPRHQYWADALAVTSAAFGNAMTANVFVVGLAFQVGALPLTAESIEEALRINGAAVEANLAAFRLGRWQAVSAMRTPVSSVPGHGAEVDRLAAELVAYQDRRYAERFVDAVERVEAAERQVTADGAEMALTLAVARNLYKLMAYKDEYEVARLMFDPEAREEAQRVAGSKGVISAKLHPPILRAAGLSRKLTFGPATRPAMALLRRGKRLRGTVLDPFHWAEVRRVERSLIPEYLAAIDRVLDRLDSSNLDAALRLAVLPDTVRGYEHIKLARVAEYRSRLADALAAW